MKHCTGMKNLEPLEAIFDEELLALDDFCVGCFNVCARK